MKKTALLLAAGLALVGCAGSPPAQFYTLSPVAESGPATSGNYSVAVGPVSLPEALERTQLVRRLDANRVEILEQARWAAPLESAIAQVVAANLDRLRHGLRATAAPGAMRPDYRVSLDVLRFDSGPGRSTQLEVLWTILDGKGQVLGAGRTAVGEMAASDTPRALVAAHDQALAALSRDIARRLPNARTRPARPLAP